MKGYKGFDKDFNCRGFQFEVGKTYKHDGDVELCHSGFHFCEYPLDVLGYYSQRFAEVESDKVSDEKDTDTKRVCRELHINAEITLGSLIVSAVKFVFDRADWSKKENHATGNRGAASATGNRGAASATGNRGAASATGNSGAASVEGQNSIASGLGVYCKAKGALGCWLVLAEWENNGGWGIKTIKTVKVDGTDIKANTWYILKNGKFVEEGI